MQQEDMRQWFRDQIEDLEKELRNLEDRIRALRLIESTTFPSEPTDSRFVFTVGPTFKNYGSINVPSSVADNVGDGKGVLKVDGRAYPVGISRKQNKNGRPRLNVGAALKRLIKDKYTLGEKLEVYIEAPLEFRLRRTDKGSISV